MFCSVQTSSTNKTSSVVSILFIEPVNCCGFPWCNTLIFKFWSSLAWSEISSIAKSFPSPKPSSFKWILISNTSCSPSKHSEICCQSQGSSLLVSIVIQSYNWPLTSKRISGFMSNVHWGIFLKFAQNLYVFSKSICIVCCQITLDVPAGCVVLPLTNKKSVLSANCSGSTHAEWSVIFAPKMLASSETVKAPGYKLGSSA